MNSGSRNFCNTASELAGILSNLPIKSFTIATTGEKNVDYPKHIVAVFALISNDEGKVVLLRHPCRGWEFPGGHVEEGEDPVVALQREVKEETGIIASVDSLIGVYSNVKQPTKVVFGFWGEWVSGELRTSNESLEVKWFDRNEVLNMILYPNFRDRAKDMLTFTGKVIYRVYTTEPYKILCERLV